VITGVVSFFSMWMYQSEEKSDESKDCFYEELEQVLNIFLSNILIIYE